MNLFSLANSRSHRQVSYESDIFPKSYDRRSDRTDTHTHTHTHTHIRTYIFIYNIKDIYIMFACVSMLGYQGVTSRQFFGIR